MIEALPILKDANGEPVLNEDGLVQYDAARMDWRLTNAKDLCHELSEECGRLVTLDDLRKVRDGEAVLKTEEGETLSWADLEPRMFLDVKALSGLKLGAIKQLKARTEQALLNLNARIKAIEEALKL
jgi:hypothetical protein